MKERPVELSDYIPSTTFWNDWMLAVNALKGKIILTPDIKRRWAVDVKMFNERMEQKEMHNDKLHERRGKDYGQMA